MIEIAPKILSSENPEDSLSQLLGRISYSSLAVIVDENTARFCLPEIHNAIEGALIITIPSGEIHKNIETCTQVWQALTEANVDRRGLVINLGGGVIGDLGGFCAATYKRGIRFLNIPTTLLSQVDASVGGKLGIDFNSYKNQIGVFQEPEFVLICPHFLDTLPQRELVSGYAEVVKHALIQDKSLWNNLKRRTVEDMKAIEPIAGAVKIKWNIVQQDFHENAQRKLLNFGHTLGHAVESYLLQDTGRQVLHGEAVAAGMIMEGYISAESGLLAKEAFKEIEAFLMEHFPYVRLLSSEVNEICDFLHQDKKNVEGKLMFTLLDAIGNGIYDQQVSIDSCAKALRHYINLQD